MIIANPMNLVNNPIEDQTLQSTNIFAIGSGHVISPEAIDPGLVYDIQPEEYICYLFGLNYTN
ncbi:subtilisin-like protease, partial [Olea europaea subsp. europaea]